MSQKTQKMFCPSCGAPVSFIEGREFTYCRYCGYQIYHEDPKLGMKLHHEQVRWKYADKKDARRLEEQRLKMQEDKHILAGIIKIILMCILGIIALTIISALIL